MKFYLAAAFSRKDEIAHKCKELNAMGVGTTSTWPWEDAAPYSTLNEVGVNHLLVNGAKDIAEIDKADGVILFTQEPTKPFVRGGRMHEFGYAQGRDKRLIVCGPRENIFHYLPSVEHFETWEGLLIALCNENVMGICEAVQNEVTRAVNLFGPHASPHESLGVIEEEFEEFKQEVFKFNLRKGRDTRPAMRAELIQLAAMAVRAIHDLRLEKQ